MMMYSKDLVQGSQNERYYNDYNTSRRPRRRMSNTAKSPKSYYERTTTVRFVLPSTGRAMCTKLNRVQRTKARV